MNYEDFDKQDGNVFENLIDELKESNLIEKTVIETVRAKKKFVESNDIRQAAVTTANREKNASKQSKPDKLNTENVTASPSEAPEISASVSDSDLIEESDFYRRQATAEVAFLRIVESAITDIERSQLKILPTSYNYTEVNNALHSFIQSAPQQSDSEPSPAEFRLLQATGSWFSTLAERDNRIMTAHLRRYSESSHPPLSVPALIALARFYRNSPYTEQARCKFDLMLTRIFAHEEPGSSYREMPLSRAELVQSIRELYAEWSSVPFYATDADDAGILQVIAQFEEFIREAQSVSSFDQLLNSNFFNRLRIFKESTNEDFYAPPVAAVAVEMNIYLGNRYIELLEKAKQSESIARIKGKYGLSNDSLISETTGKTLTLLELLNQNHAPRSTAEKESVRAPAALRRQKPVSKPKPAAAAAVAETIPELPNSRKWLLAAIILVVIALGVYWKSSSVKVENPAVAPTLNLENSRLKDYLRETRIEDATLNGIAAPS